MATPLDWRDAFLKQSLTDLETYEHLCKSTLPPSQRLHLLQMWLEKLCKAYQWNQDGEAPHLHGVVTKVLPGLVKELWRRQRAAGDLAAVRRLSREVDILHPQVDDAGQRMDNAEYPWPAASGIQVPAQWTFGILDELEKKGGKRFLKDAMVLTRNPSF